jgi:cytoskeletal protein CcmA (bactofilin family)
MKHLIALFVFAAALPALAQPPPDPRVPPVPAVPAAPAAPAAPSAPAATVDAARVEHLNEEMAALRRQLDEARAQIEQLKGAKPNVAQPATPTTVVHTGSVSYSGQDYTVPPNEVVDGNVRLVGGDLRITGRVDGDATTSGGDLSVLGHVAGNVATVGGDVSLGPTAVVDGDVQVMGGDLQRAPGSQIHGNVRITGGPSVAGIAHSPNTAAALIFTPLNLPMAFVLFFVGMIMLVAWPGRMDTVGNAFVNRPVHSFLVGLTSIPAFVLICLTIVGLFFAPIVWISAFAMGVCAMALMLGRRLVLGRPYKSRIFPLLVGLGSWFLAMAFSRLLGPLFPLMVVATALAYITALGATFSTGFGKSPLWLRERLQGRRHTNSWIDPSETYAGR